MPSQCTVVKSMIRLAIIGDVHRDWSAKLDPVALSFLKPDAAIFVGDFGEEDVPLVEKIASLDTPKGVILGNHDAWDALYYKGSHKRLDRQLEVLGTDHIGYSSKKFKAADGSHFSVVGARPFSDGNDSRWELAEEKFNFEGSYGSAVKIRDEIKKQPVDNPVILVGHNGPTGLGDRRQDPCGRDFAKRQGDHGDSDLEQAILMAGSGKISLVTFGHMHQALQDARNRQLDGTKRNMVHIDPETGTAYVNAAVAPRHRYSKKDDILETHFVIVEIENNVVVSAENVWVSNADSPVIVESEKLITSTRSPEGLPIRKFYRAFDKSWTSEIPFQGICRA